MLVRVLASTIAISALLVQPPAPEVLRPGDSKIQAAALQPYKVRSKETLVNVVNQVIERGTWDDQLVRESHNGREVLRRTIVITEPAGSVRERYEVLVDARTFAPVRSTWESKGQSYAYAYDDTTVRATRITEANGPPRAINASLPHGAFDYYGGMMELFLATLPRAAGRLYTFPAILATSGPAADQNAIDWPIVRVFDAETTRGAGGSPVRATRIEANTAYGFFKVWVTDVPPYVVRTVLVLAPGGRITYELF